MDEGGEQHRQGRAHDGQRAEQTGLQHQGDVDETSVRDRRDRLQRPASLLPVARGGRLEALRHLDVPRRRDELTDDVGGDGPAEEDGAVVQRPSTELDAEECARERRHAVLVE